MFNIKNKKNYRILLKTKKLGQSRCQFDKLKNNIICHYYHVNKYTYGLKVFLIHIFLNIPTMKNYYEFKY